VSNNLHVSQDPFGDIPLFREIQRILQAGQGPVNFEIARQVATAVATEGHTEPHFDPPTERDYRDAVRAAEVVLTGYTRRPLDEPMQVLVVDRRWWVGSTLTAWRWLFESMSTRFSDELAKMQPDSESAGGPLGATMGQVAPLLLGMQAGTLIGHLSKEVLGRYDIPIARDDDGKLFFVDRNVRDVAKEYGFDTEVFRKWLALHDAARHVIATSVPWFNRYYRSLLAELVESIEIDTQDLERRLMELQSKGMEALENIDDALPVVQTERHRGALDRLHAFVALFEGYARHSCEEVAADTTGDTTTIDEGMSRHHASPSEAQRMLATALGVSHDRTLETAGKTFCAAVIELRGLPSLNRAWEAPDNLPSRAEIKDPFAWMERVLPG
jgi:putative hydrolase